MGLEETGMGGDRVQYSSPFSSLVISQVILSTDVGY